MKVFLNIVGCFAIALLIGSLYTERHAISEGLIGEMGLTNFRIIYYGAIIFIVVSSLILIGDKLSKASK